MMSSMKKKTAFIASRIEILVDFERAMVANRGEFCSFGVRCWDRAY